MPRESVNGVEKTLKIGSRKSKLALIQTEEVIKRLKDYYGEDKYEYEIVTMSTTGDNNLSTPLAEIGSKALFTKELEEALLSKDVDFIVHSMKDLPTTLPPGCCIGAVLKRENPNDVLVLKRGLSVEKPIISLNSSNSALKTLTIGTSSLRRIAQLKYYFPDAKCVNIRGNLNTRFAKLDDTASDYSALLLASAGIQRLGFEDRITERLSGKEWFYAVGQGALAVECREDDRRILDILTPICHYDTSYECICERTLMKLLEGGCSVPIGVRCAWETVDNDDVDKRTSKLTLSGAVFSLDGKMKVEDSLVVDLDEAVENSSSNFTGIALPSSDLSDFENVKRRYVNSEKLGRLMADCLKGKGALNILNEIKQGKQKLL